MRQIIGVRNETKGERITVVIGVLFKNVQLEIIKLQRNGLHLNCSVNFGNLKLRIPLTFGIKSENCGNKNLGQIIQIRNCYILKCKIYIYYLH